MIWKRLEAVRVGGMDVAVASREELTNAWIEDAKSAALQCRAVSPRLVFDANGHAISLRRTDEQYKRSVDAGDIIHADGGFIVTLSRFICNRKIKERSATTDMIHDFAVAAVENNLSFYLLGGTEDVNKECAEILAVRYPGLRIVGRRNGYFASEQEYEVVANINSAKPDILWVGLGKPKEQDFAVRNKERLKATWVATCGGCFNFVTGKYSRAPQWMQSFNLEWVHRAATQPRHLLLRYLMTTPHALAIILFSRK